MDQVSSVKSPNHKNQSADKVAARLECSQDLFEFDWGILKNSFLFEYEFECGVLRRETSLQCTVYCIL